MRHQLYNTFLDFFRLFNPGCDQKKKKKKSGPIKMSLLRAQLDNTQQQLDNSFSPAHGVDWLIASALIMCTGPDIFKLQFHVGASQIRQL